MRKVKLLATQNSEAGYAPVYIPTHHKKTKQAKKKPYSGKQTLPDTYQQTNAYENCTDLYSQDFTFTRKHTWDQRKRQRERDN